jgi:hypothetical protein
VLLYGGHRCVAVVEGFAFVAQVQAFLERQAVLIADRQRLEYNLIQQTKVDFKLMEQD